MKKSEVQKLEYGLYEVYWKSGGKSLAAVGGMPDGTHWLAPCNWIMPTTQATVKQAWRQVKQVILIKAI